MLVREQSPSLRRVAGAVEVVQRVGIRGEVAGLARVQARAGDPGLAHALGHLRHVIPESGGEIEEGPRTCRAAEVGADLAADTVDGVAGGAAFGREQALAG